MSLSFQKQQNQLATSSRSAVERLWDSLVQDSVNDEVASRFSGQAARVVQAHQARSVSLADSFIRAYERASTGTVSGEPVNPGSILRTLRGSTPLELVYERPIVTARTALSRGEPFVRAVAIGRARAAANADTDVILASRAGSAEAMARSSRIVGYRRVPDSGACEFCLLVSTQRYTKERLMPIHNHCHCSVAPIIGTTDPGRVIDSERLARIKNGKVRRPDGERIDSSDVEVREHGELGPVLTLARHSFTSQSEVV